MQRAPFMHGFDMHDLYAVTYIHTNTRVYHIRINNIQQDSQPLQEHQTNRASMYRHSHYRNIIVTVHRLQCRCIRVHLNIHNNVNELTAR